MNSGGSRNFKNRRWEVLRAWSSSLGSGVFDTPSHKPYAFTARVENKHTYCKHQMFTTFKLYMLIMQSKNTKPTKKKFKRRGREEKKKPRDIYYFLFEIVY